MKQSAHLFSGAEIEINTDFAGEEVEIYIGGYFLTSVDFNDISKEAFYELTGEEK